MVTVSVVVPVYNTGKFLKRCIDSIMTQTYQQFEVILINDGSTDDSLSVCKEIVEKYPIIQLIDKINEGVSTARNVGIELAKGKYICFIDSDDYLSNNYLEELVLTIEKSKSDVVVCGYYKENHNHKLTKMVSNYKLDISREKAMEQLYINNSFSALPWNKLYNLNLIKEYNLKFNVELRMTQDLVFNTEYFKICKKIEYISKPLYYYMFNDDSVCRRIKTSGKFNEKNLITLKAHKITEDLLKDESDFVKNAFNCRFVCTYLRLLVNMCYSSTLNKKILLDIKQNVRKRLKIFLKYKNYGILQHVSAIMVAFTPSIYYYCFRMLIKCFKINV